MTTKEIEFQAIQEFRMVSFNGDTDSSEVQRDGNQIYRSFSNNTFFADGPQAILTESDEFLNKVVAEKKAKKFLSEQTLSYYDVRVYNEGIRGFFLIILSPKE